MRELERIGREPQASLALAMPDSPARVPILAHTSAINTEPTTRAGQPASLACRGAGTPEETGLAQPGRVADSRDLFLATSPPCGQYSAERMIII